MESVSVFFITNYTSYKGPYSNITIGEPTETYEFPIYDRVRMFVRSDAKNEDAFMILAELTFNYYMDTLGNDTMLIEKEDVASSIVSQYSAYFN